MIAVKSKNDNTKVIKERISRRFSLGRQKDKKASRIRPKRIKKRHPQKLAIAIIENEKRIFFSL